MDYAKKLNVIAIQLMELGNLEMFIQNFREDYTVFLENKTFKGLDKPRKHIQQLRKSIPNIKVKNIEILSINNQKITWQRTFEGTHKKAMQGIPASNKKLIWNEMVVSEFDGDKIAKEWIVSELMGQMLLHVKK